MPTSYQALAPSPGALYRHYKGDLYRVLCVSELSNTGYEGSPVVVYESVSAPSDTVHVRTLTGASGWATPCVDGTPRYVLTTGLPGLPPGVDPALWFVSSDALCHGGVDYLFDAHWNTFPGRLAAFCPHTKGHPVYRLSKAELPDDLPAATRYFVAGFLAGNLPSPPDDEAAFDEFDAAAILFAETGYWPPALSPEEFPVLAVPATTPNKRPVV